MEYIDRIVPAITLVVALVTFVTLLRKPSQGSIPQCTDSPEEQFWLLYREANLDDRRSMRIGADQVKYAVTDPSTGVTFTLTKTYR